MDSILKIVMEANQKNKLLSDDDVRKICQIIIQKNNYDFIKNISFFPINILSENCSASYYSDSIRFFEYGVMNLIDKCYDSFVNEYNLDSSKTAINNYFYLCIIFHELSHVRQHYLMDKYPNYFESKLFILCHKMIDNREFYENNYYSLLTEVNATNRGSVTAYNLYRSMPKEEITKNDLRCYSSILLNCILNNNYQIFPKEEVILSPSEVLIANLENKKIDFDINEYIKLINDTSKFTLYQKLMLGLPIDYLEYAYSSLIYNLSKTEDINVIRKLQKKIK